MNYDAWFDFLRLLEAERDIEQIRDTYERAIANLPPTQVSSLISEGLYKQATEGEMKKIAPFTF